MTDRSSVDSLQYRYVTVSDVKGLGRRTAPPGSRISRDPSMLQSHESFTSLSVHLTRIECFVNTRRDVRHPARPTFVPPHRSEIGISENANCTGDRKKKN